MARIELDQVSKTFPNGHKAVIDATFQAADGLIGATHQEVGVADMRAGGIDPGVLAVLTKLSQEHEITVSCMCSDHSKFTAGGNVSRLKDPAAIYGKGAKR